MCEDVGGGGGFSKVKLLVRKWIKTQRWLFWRKQEKSALRVGVQNAGPFPLGIFCPHKQVFMGSWNFQETFGVEPILGR